MRRILAADIGRGSRSDAVLIHNNKKTSSAKILFDCVYSYLLFRRWKYKQPSITATPFATAPTTLPTSTFCAANMAQAWFVPKQIEPMVRPGTTLRHISSLHSSGVKIKMTVKFQIAISFCQAERPQSVTEPNQNWSTVWMIRDPAKPRTQIATINLAVRIFELNILACGAWA
jgi:hypothetical protein